MNLKQNIDKTDTLKNNLKIVINQIKQSIVRGGGSDFKSLANAPERITDLLGQYKKMAIGEVDYKLTDYYYDFKIATNLGFKPSKVLVNFECVGSYTTSKKSIYLRLDNASSTISHVFFYDNYSRTQMDIIVEEITENLLSLKARADEGNSSNTYDVRIKNWIAIE